MHGNHGDYNAKVPNDIIYDMHIDTYNAVTNDNFESSTKIIYSIKLEYIIN